MKKIVTRMLAVAIAFTTMLSMSGIMTVNAEAATKSNVTVSYTGKKVKSASIKSVTATVDGAKTAKKNVTVYLTGKSKVKIDTAVKVTVKGKKTSKMSKTFKNNYKKVTYSSSNKKVATVSSKGVITAKKAGTTTITIKSKADKKKTYKIKLTVKNGVKSMKLNAKTKKTLTVGEKYAFTPKVTTYKKVKTTITASTSNKKVATVSVSKKGKVTITAKKAGTAKITVAPKYGSDKAKVITITVKKKATPAPTPAPETPKPEEPKPTPAPTPVVKEYRTKVDFANPVAKTVTLKGTLTWDDQSGIDDAVVAFAKALGGTYEVTVNGRTTNVVNGVVSEEDLAKIPESGSKTNATVTASMTIADVLKMVGNVDAKATAKFTGSFKLSGVEVSNISLANKELTFKLGNAEMKAYVLNGNLYLDGDQSALLKTYETIYDANKTIIKGFTVEEVK